MVLIRPGMMKDCIDLLEVYQGTRWFYRAIQGGYKTVEQVKEEHRGAAFERWGWLVAEEKKRVIGEIVFRVEKTGSAGRVGIIRNLDIDVRNQKAKVGTQLTKAAEIAMKKKKVARVIATTPPAAYNYWMKVKYFARGSIVNLSLPLSKIPEKKRAVVKYVELREQKKLPKSMHFSNIAYPGSLSELAGKVIDGKLPGRLFEFHIDDNLGGIGVVAKSDANVADFAADITRRGAEYSDLVISRTARAASTLKVKKVSTSIPKDQLSTYMSLAKWSSETSTDIPVTKLL